MLPEVIRFSQALIAGEVRLVVISQRPTDIQMISGPDID